MCGIYGYIDRRGINYKANSQVLNAALDTLAHRGPDGRGVWFNDEVFLGHRRLSIIDTSEKGSQPMSNLNGDIQIVFNGEIYNYRELSSGFSELQSDSDTEIILKGYEKNGIDFFYRLRGIFAFCIMDNRFGEKKLILYRDPSGVKPLYYFFDGTFIFSSEIKAIVASGKKLSIKEDIVKSYLLLGYCMEPSTIYEEVKALIPGSLMIYDYLSNELSNRTLSTYHFIPGKEDGSQTHTLLKEAVKRNMVADVPIKFALSGGIDSSLITALASKVSDDVQALTVSFYDSEYDESKIAELFAKELRISLEKIKLDSNSNIDTLNRIFLHFDQPFADSSAIPFYFLAKSASKYGKVLIGGDGGDEIHNGYPSFNWLPVLWTFRKVIPFKLIKALSKLIGRTDLERKFKRLESIAKKQDISDAVFIWQCWFSPEKIKGISPFKFSIDSALEDFKKEFISDDTRSNTHSVILEKYFYKRMLSDYLRKSDMMSMQSSLEYRVPMLDEDLVSYSLSIKYSLKSKLGKGKLILRELHSKIFPVETSHLKKSGFSVPLDDWLSAEDFDHIQNELMREDGIIHEYVNTEYIQFLFISLKNRDDRLISRASVYQRILILYNLQNWYLNQFENSLHRK